MLRSFLNSPSLHPWLLPALAMLALAWSGPLRAEVGSGPERAESAPVRWHDHQALRDQAGRWIERQAADAFPGTDVAAELGRIDPRLRLSRCPQPEFFLPAGSRLWGSGSLGLRCAAPSPWSLYLTYRIRLAGPALVARRPLPARHALAADDVIAARVDYLANPASYLKTLPAGTQINRPLPAGQPVLLETLVQPMVVKAGGKVRMRVNGPGFQVVQEGIALNSARLGENVRIKTSSGRVVQGRAKSDGEVELAP